jgi:hypothetical protein
MAGIFDGKRQRVTFFGGDAGFPKNCNPAPSPIGELWTYDVACAGFEQVPLSSGPGPRARAMAAHDESGDRMLLFGGRFRSGSSGAYTLYNEVWALDLNTLAFQALSPSGPAPEARSNAAGGVNPLSNELVLFGGNTSTDGLIFAPKNDVWALDLKTNTWREVTTTGAPPDARLFHAAAIDPKGGALFIYGGGGANAFQGPFYTDLWRLDLASGTWEELHDGKVNAPIGRISPTIAFDGVTGRVLLFGGHDDGAVGNNNDTWSFDLASRKWSVIVPPESVKTSASGFCEFPKDFTVANLAAPDRRSAHLGAFDGAGRQWIVFGGKTDCGIINDAWSFDAASNAWSNAVKATIGEACLRGPFHDQCTSLCQ